MTDSVYIPPSGINQKRLKYLLAGGVAGAISRTVTAPLDRIRVLLQTQTTPSTSKHWISYYKDAFLKIYHSGGALAFYRGNGINALKVFPESSLKFFIFETFKDVIAKFMNVKKREDIGIQGRFVAGGMAGLISQFVIYPLETIKTRIMSQIHHTESTYNRTSVVSIVKSMFQQGGIRSFYHGLTPSLIGIVPYAGIDLTVFETLRVTYMAYQRKSCALKNEKPPDSPPLKIILCFGILSGTTGATIMYPLSVIRTRLQAQGTLSHPEYYSSTMDVIHKTYAREGIGGFYKGIAPTLVKVLPAVSISYVVYEKSKKILGVH